MKVVDPHIHLWDLGRLHYPWLTDLPSTGVYGDNTPIRKNYLLDSLLQESSTFTIDKVVHVEAAVDSGEQLLETEWLQAIADEPASSGRPNGIVVACDLDAADVGDTLDQHLQSANVRGVRQILNTSNDPRLSFIDVELMQRDSWVEGFGELGTRGLSFDLQIYPHQMRDAAALARRFPDTQLILNHTGMPHDLDSAYFAEWRWAMETLTACPNVSVKISGLGMMFHDWTVETIRPFVLETIASFGANRAMFASNFPVDGMYSSYDVLWEAYVDIVRDFSDDDRTSLFHDTAERIYQL
ncbi:MAG: amidohydrolase family protein [Ilumatobacteraceae bacterium]